MIGSPWYRVGDIDEEETKREKGGHPYVDLLRGNTVEDRQKHGGSEDSRKYDVHDVERVTSTEVYPEGNVGEPLMRATFEVEFIPNGGRLEHVPFSVYFVGVEADLDGRSREVHLGGVVRPGAEDQLTMLGIEWVVCDIDATHCLEHTTRLPPNRAVGPQGSLELLVFAIYTLGSDGMEIYNDNKLYRILHQQKHKCEFYEQKSMLHTICYIVMNYENVK